MNYFDFTKQLSVITQLPVKRIEQLVYIMVEALVNELKKGNYVKIPMFSAFYVGRWQARLMYNLHTETVTHFGARNQVKAVTLSVLKQQMNPAWCVTRSFSDIRQYPDSDLSKLMFEQGSGDFWQTRQFIYELALFGMGLIQSNQKFVLQNFGTFTMLTRAAGFKRDPETGFPIFVEERYYLKFRMSERLRESLN